MSSSISVKEQKHNFWKTGTIISLVFCLILFTIFWNTDHVLWSNILRLSAFIFFALTILGYLKIMDGPLEVTIKEEDNLLVVIYEKNEKNIQEEQFNRDTIKNVMITEKDKNLLTSYLQPEAATFNIEFTDTDRNLYLFEFGGRPLLFGSRDQQKIITYLEECNINCCS